MSGGGVTIRAATEDDLRALTAIYADAVRTVGPAHYSAEQVRAWAAFAEGPTVGRWLREALVLVAEDASGPVGFAGLAADGHVTALYVRPDRMRMGIAGRLLMAVLERAAARGVRRLYAEASLFSKPVFERFGFVVDEVEVVERGGVTFVRHRMTRAPHDAHRMTRG